MNYILGLLCSFFSMKSFSLAITYDYSEVTTEFNYFSIPASKSDEIDLPKGKGGMPHVFSLKLEIVSQAAGQFFIHLSR